MLRRPNPRLLLTIFLITAFVLGLVSLGSAWWAYTASGGGGSNSLLFFPGGTYNVACSGSHCAGFSAGSFPYSAFGGSLGSLYEADLGLMLAAVLLTGAATAIAILGWLGRRMGWWQRAGSFVLIVLAFLFSIAAVAGTVAAQPGSFAANTSFSGLGGGGASPLTSFWGSDASSSAVWGAGAGWYVAAAMACLLVVICAVLVLAGHERLEVAERRNRVATVQPIARSPTPVAPTVEPVMRGYTAPPPAQPYARPVVTRPASASYSGTRVTPRPTKTPTAAKSEDPPDAPVSRAPPPPATAPAPAPEMIECPECGTPNLAKSRTCSYCQRPLRS